MHLSQLQILVALVETGSFTEAAFALDITQSAVSHALATLEDELGVTLIERNRKGLFAVTAVGQKVLLHAREILTHAETIRQEAATVRGQLAGKLRLGSIQAVSPRLLAGAMSHFQQQYPEVKVVMFEGTGPEVYEWINTDIVDVGFIHYPLDGIESTLIATDEMQVFVPEEHHLLQREAVTLNDLRAERFIMPKLGCDFIDLLGREPSGDGPHIQYKASDSTTILAMVREGLGITLLPRMMLPEKLEGVHVLTLDPPHPLQFGLAVKSQATASPTAKLFIQVAREWSQDHCLLSSPHPALAPA